MKFPRPLPLIALCAATSNLGGCAHRAPSESLQADSPYTIQTNPTVIGGQHALSVDLKNTDGLKEPQITGFDIVPGKGMNIFQVRGFLPGKGVVNVFASPSLEQQKAELAADKEDLWGNRNFYNGGALLIPYANRIRGKHIPGATRADDLTEAQVMGKTLQLPANWGGKKPGAERHSIHGLVYNVPFPRLEKVLDADSASITGMLEAGNFGGHWLSKTGLAVRGRVKDGKFLLTVNAKNIGSEPLPIGIGWHPYFALPSGKRDQARVHLPASRRAIANNYDDAFPTGKLETLKGSKYDFTPAQGKKLNALFVDDAFVDLKRDASGAAVAEVTDPAARYGVRIRALSPEIKAFQMYAPTDKSFVAIEPQFNWGDPYGKAWQSKKVDTGMVVLQPGQSVTYEVELELFKPGAAK